MSGGSILLVRVEGEKICMLRRVPSPAPPQKVILLRTTMPQLLAMLSTPKVPQVARSAPNKTLANRRDWTRCGIYVRSERQMSKAKDPAVLLPARPQKLRWVK